MKYITHIPRQQDFKIWLALLVFVVGLPVLTLWSIRTSDPLLLGPLFVLLGFFIFNLAVRKRPAMKPYFMSSLNILTSKVKHEFTFEFSKDLAFEKVKEVLEDSAFSLVAADKDRLELQASSGISWKSWGENIYIWLEGDDERSVMKFCSVTLFQVYSWGKNEDNGRRLIDAIEESLTI